MDKTLLKAYIRTIVEEEVKRVLPELLSEAVAQVKQISEVSAARPTPKPALDRSKLAAMMGMSYDGNTLRADTSNVASRLPDTVAADADPSVVAAINKDYSALMKKMGLSK
jgi:hypothetical protein